MSTEPVPNPHASAEEVEAARHDRKHANVLYHDWEAGSYDDRSSIPYDERCITYPPYPFPHATVAPPPPSHPPSRPDHSPGLCTDTHLTAAPAGAAVFGHAGELRP